MTPLQAIILAVVEGITEYLPVSSTGHMIITNSLIGVPNDAFTKAYIVVIQFGAILSVVALYWRRFLSGLNFYWRLFVGFIPAAVIGFTLNDYIDQLLESVTVVAISLFLGGVFFVTMDRWIKSGEKESVSNNEAFKIGFYQCIAMIPGVSRSAATIIGGLFQGLSRKTAAEFSFFLAVPTMFGATAYKLLKIHDQLGGENLKLILVGNIIAFVVAALAIKAFIRFLGQNSLKYFGWYRIIVGGAILIMIYGLKIDLQIF